MIYLIAYNLKGMLVLAMNRKGQFTGSTSKSEAIAMLPEYNLYNLESDDAIKKSTPWEYKYRHCVVKVSSIIDAFDSTEEKISEYCDGKIFHYAEIKPECSRLIKLIEFQPNPNTIVYAE